MTEREGDGRARARELAVAGVTADWKLWPPIIAAGPRDVPQAVSLDALGMSMAGLAREAGRFAVALARAADGMHTATRGETAG